ncbi:MAG: 50S ribosomal protein L4 [Nitrospiraceae bacterium]|nr:50S ribosomal protein L4 [Nitrospiraceae bacterium]
MPELEIKDKNNKSVGKIALSDDVFGVTAKQGVLHNAVVNFLANQRQGTHATKTKGFVSGGGKKPWKQKHTGRARAGSSRSPLWRGGGIVFGPQPRDYSYSLPKKARRLALKAVLSGKVADGEVTVIDSLQIDKPRTRDVVSLLKSLSIDGKSTLIILPEYSKTVMLSARNIPGVSVRCVTDLNSYDIAVHHRLLMTKQAAEMLSEASKK